MFVYQTKNDADMAKMTAKRVYDYYGGRIPYRTIAGWMSGRCPEYGKILIEMVGGELKDDIPKVDKRVGEASMERCGDIQLVQGNYLRRDGKVYINMSGEYWVGDDMGAGEYEVDGIGVKVGDRLMGRWEL